MPENNGKPLEDPQAWRVAIDYRKLNKITRFPNYAMPRIEDLLHGVKAHKIMTSLDLTFGYYQIPIREQDIPKTVFVVPLRTLRYQDATLSGV